MDMLTKGIGLGLEPLSCNDTVPIDYEQTLFQVLVNEGKHIRVRFFVCESLQYFDNVPNQTQTFTLFCIREQVLNAKRPQFSYNGKKHRHQPTYRIGIELFTLLTSRSYTEKQLRDAAAAEVAVHGLYGNEDLGDKSSRKRKHMNADEKAKQKCVKSSP